MLTESKAKAYSTAKAVVSCALFAAGDFVAVEFNRIDENGVFWFKVTSPKGSTYYPSHHLTSFVF